MRGLLLPNDDRRKPPYIPLRIPARRPKIPEAHKSHCGGALARTAGRTAVEAGGQGHEKTRFYKMPVDRLLDNSVTDFDLFVNVNEHLILYSGLGYRWTRDELQRLLAIGCDQFLIKGSDLPRAKMYEVMSKLPEIDKTKAPKERIRTIEDVGATFIKCLHEGDITPACVSKAESIAQSMVQCIAEDPSCIKELSGLIGHDYYTYYHSVRVASYAVAMATKMGLTDETYLHQMALGGIFHDIGKREVPLEILNKAGPLTAPEWEQMKAHPREGFNHISQTILTHVPREIILHHHEKLDGSGYPDALESKSLIMEVQIATLADVFDALTSSRCYQQKRSRYEGLDFIKHKMLGSKVSVEAYKALIGCLA